MNRLFTAVALLSAMVLVSCERPVKFNAPGYVSEYCFASVRTQAVEVAPESAADGRISIQLPFAADRSVKIIDYFNNSEASEYYELCCRFGDLEYDQRVSWTTNSYFHPGNGVSVVGDILSSISIESDAAWDEEHPAGAPLDDLFSVRFATVYPYIYGGYKGDVIACVDKPVVEVTSEDMTLVRNFRACRPSLRESELCGDMTPGFMELYTDAMPQSAVRKLAVTITTSEGRRVVYDVTLNL